MEGWHRAFDLKIKITHPSFSKLIHKIILQQCDNEITLEKLKSGHELAKQKRNYIQLNSRIVKLVNQYRSVPRLEFLRVISNNLSF